MTGRGSRGEAAGALAVVVLVCALSGLLLLLALLCSPAHAYDEDPETVLWQARSCVGETHWDLDTCTAMAHVHRKRAELRGVSTLFMIRAYSAPVRVAPPARSARRASGPVDADAARARIRHLDAMAQRRRRWIRLLRPTGPEPDGWPERLSWPRYRARFAEVYRHVGRVLRGEIEDPCPDALHYGGPAWLDATPEGYEVDPTCLPDSDSRQRFFRPIAGEDAS